MENKHKEHKPLGKNGKNCCGDMKTTQFYDASKKYDFGLYKADPSVDVMTKTKVDF